MVSKVGSEQPSLSQEERWQHHWRFCPADDVVVIRDNWAFRVSYCKHCPNRIVETKPNIFILSELLNAFAKIYAEHVFGEPIEEREL